MEYIKSPINYSGSKYRLIKKGLIELFPKDINTFVDLFCGACNVGINVNANKIVFNDYIPYILDLYKNWKSYKIEETNKYIDNTIDKWKLSSTNKESFEKFRDNYNLTKDIRDLFILICYSFNYQMRFNNSHEYNSSFGKEASTMNKNIRNNVNLFIEQLHKKDIIFCNYDFRELKIDNLSDKDFVYLDPPYLVSGAVYQDGKRGFKGWCQQDDLDMYNLCDTLNDKNIRFAMSNMLESKGNKNETLIEWSKKYNIKTLDINYNGSNYQRKTNGKDIEVLITNY